MGQAPTKVVWSSAIGECLALFVDLNGTPLMLKLFVGNLDIQLKVKKDYHNTSNKTADDTAHNREILYYC